MYSYAQRAQFDIVLYVAMCSLSHSFAIDLFSYQLALNRLLRYWTSRHKLFGDKYTQPLTLHGTCLELCRVHVCISYVLISNDFLYRIIASTIDTRDAN